MMTPRGMEEMIAVMVARGMERSRAADYAARIGDTIEHDDAGKWIVRDDAGQVIYRIEPLLGGLSGRQTFTRRTVHRSPAFLF